MRQILILGAGKSAPYLIKHLLSLSEEKDWRVTVADLDAAAAQARVGDHPRGRALGLDVNDGERRRTLVRDADLVVSLLAPPLHPIVAMDCVESGTHLVTASYRDRRLRALDADARQRDVMILCEMGMDPGIDHMSAMSLVREVRDRGGHVRAFRSYGAGLPAPEVPVKPLRYAITWNPRNVAIAAQYGAQYLERGKIKLIPYHEVFHHTWDVSVDGLGAFEAYPNRDSLGYLETFGLEGVDTMIRGTLRYPGWSETWAQLVRLGLTNDTLSIPDLGRRSPSEVVEMCLPLTLEGSSVARRTARWLQISPTGSIMEKLRWLGIFDEVPSGCAGNSAADLLTHLLVERLPLRPGERDLVILQHELDVAEDAGGRPTERIVSTLIDYGEPDGLTAMSKTVGLPAAIGATLILDGEISLRGCHIPTHPSIYEPTLAELSRHGLGFEERRAPIA